MPSTTFTIPIDTLRIKKNGLKAETLNAFYTPEIKWTLQKNSMS